MPYTEQQHSTFSRAIFDSLLHSELLVTDLPRATRFDRSLLAMPAAGTQVDFKQKLGHLFEDALAATIAAADGLKLIGQSVQLPGTNGQTLGEMDFLILNHARQQHIHLELATKFYLAHQDEAGVTQLPGPDARDNWPRKFKRLTSHQLRLSEIPEVQQHLKDRFGIEALEVAHLIYGCLFDHIDASPTTNAPAISATCRRGKWLRRSEIGTLCAHTDKVTILPKPLWPVPILNNPWSDLPHCQIPQLLQVAEQRCVMFSIQDIDCPMFMVPDSWPAEREARQ
ncbi:MAG: DUF1853 family protein [Verrucomicrobiae bacterium]|nr:DUF1853 family protein [Verrucomicrobiae bacterium]